MQADGVAGRNNSTRDDVVAVDQRASNGLTDAVDVDGGCCDERNYEAGGGSQQGGDHQHTEPAHVQAIVGGGDPLAEGLPAIGAGALLNGGGHENGKSAGTNPSSGKESRITDPVNVKVVCAADTMPSPSTPDEIDRSGLSADQRCALSRESACSLQPIACRDGRSGLA